MGIPMGIPMGMGMGWVWGLKFNPHGSPAIFTKPNAKRVQARLKCRNVLAVIGWQKSNIELRVVRVLLLRDLV